MAFHEWVCYLFYEVVFKKKKPHHDLNHDSEVQVPDFSLSVGLLMK